MTMTNANRIQAAAMVKAAFDQTHFEYFAISPTPHQAANTNRNCQQNGLKYHVVPGGNDAMVQPNQRDRMKSTIEPTKVRFGRRTRLHTMNGAAKIKTI